MLSGEQVEDISNIDSCQATVTSKETIQTVTAYTTSTVVSTPVRRTFEEQKPFCHCRLCCLLHHRPHYCPDCKKSTGALISTLYIKQATGMTTNNIIPMAVPFKHL